MKKKIAFGENKNKIEKKNRKKTDSRRRGGKTSLEGKGRDESTLTSTKCEIVVQYSEVK